MSDKFDLIVDSIKDLKGDIQDTKESLHSIDKTLIQNTESLKEHIKRTNLLEEQVQIVKKELRPVELHVHNVNFIMKILGVLGGSSAVIYYTLQVVKFLKN